jgi:hypothetical protein
MGTLGRFQRQEFQALRTSLDLIVENFCFESPQNALKTVKLGAARPDD